MAVSRHGSGESKSDSDSGSESGEVKVGRISGQMDGWIDLLVGGNGDLDGKGGGKMRENRACKAWRLEERTSCLLMVPGGGKHGNYHGEPQYVLDSTIQYSYRRSS